MRLIENGFCVEYDDADRLKTGEKLEMLGIEPVSFRMQSGRSATEPHTLRQLARLYIYSADHFRVENCLLEIENIFK